METEGKELKMVFECKDEFLISLAEKNNLDMDKFLSAYLIMGEQFLLLLHAFEGQDLHVPSKRKLSAPSLHNILFIEDDEEKYCDYVKGNVITKNDVDYVVIAKERKILNHIYIPVIKEENVGDLA